jgi:hypothetical protein
MNSAFDTLLRVAFTAFFSMFLGACASSTRHFVVNSPKGSICEVHRINRSPDTVPVVYGIFNTSESDLYVRQKCFPNAWTYVRRGCVVREEEEKFVEVMFCPECRQEQAKWLKLTVTQRAKRAEQLGFRSQPNMLDFGRAASRRSF